VIQPTINQRLKILIEKVSPNAKAFSETIEESPATTHNYIGKRQTEPRAQYLAKVLYHFADLNARWLMTGEGEAFPASATEPPIIYQTQKKNTGNVIGTNNGTATVNHLAECEKDLLAAQKEIAGLNSQLADKDELIRSKQEIIDLLRNNQPKP